MCEGEGANMYTCIVYLGINVRELFCDVLYGGFELLL